MKSKFEDELIGNVNNLKIIYEDSIGKLKDEDADQAFIDASSFCDLLIKEIKRGNKEKIKIIYDDLIHYHRDSVPLLHEAVVACNKLVTNYKKLIKNF